MSNNAFQKIAIIHDWFLGVGGAENVAKELHKIFPSAPIYTLLYNEEFTRKFMPDVDIRPSFLQKYYNRLGSHKLLLPFMPLAVESFDLSKFDLIISSSAYFSKGLVLKPHTTHICYCHSPTRQWWDWQVEYKKEIKKTPKWAAALLQHSMRIWDRHASTRVDYFIANSENVRHRIQKYYQRDAKVIYPPVWRPGRHGDPVAKPNYQPPATSYFLIVSRLYKHKNIDIAIQAFKKLGWPLVIIGDGSEKKRLKRLASPNIKILGFVPDNKLKKYYENCIAFIMPQEEDFGIAPIEAMSYGKPVLALKRGGALEYIEEGMNGEFFDDPDPDVLAYNVMRIKSNLLKYNPEKIKRTAERFSGERFKKGIIQTINRFII